MFNEIPNNRPVTPLLDSIDSPADLRKLEPSQLEQLATQLRHFLLYTVGRTGGHFGAGLGVVELTIALHYVFDTPNDNLIWDVGHQTYPHKILTGRREAMHTLRQPQGIAPFPLRSESVYDTFGVGHSSTSISAALGIHLADTLAARQVETVVVIGDGAMTAGMAFEALNHVAASNANMLVILNDNAMSISENVGGLANYFARNISASNINTNRTVGASANQENVSADQRASGSIFTDLGFNYSGPIDGHNIDQLIEAFGTLKRNPGPKLLHVITQKGKGYGPAERSPVASHSMTKLEKEDTSNSNTRSYSSIFGDWIVAQALKDKKLVAITPAMKEGSGLARFAESFPDRFHDVAIAEQHAITFAAGLSCGGAKPVVAIYSTFLQRGYDQLIHDIALQNLDVLFAVDRAGLLEDGPTHSGVFDLSFTRAIPNLIIMVPADEHDMLRMLDFGYQHPGPCIVRYPRGSTPEPLRETSSPIALGKAQQILTGTSVALLSFGATGALAKSIAEAETYTMIDMRFVKPLDTDIIESLSKTHNLLVTLEENTISGGAGSAVNELVHALGLPIDILNIGIPDQFVEQDTPTNMHNSINLNQAQITAKIHQRLKHLGT